MLEQDIEETGQVDPPELSVIICTRDRADTLLLAVNSVLAEIPADGSAELLVVDQGRDDSAAKTLAPLLANDSRLRYLHETSMGASACRNAGARLARGPLLAFMDDDCTVEPGWFQALKGAFHVHPDTAIIFGEVAPAPYDPAEGFLPYFRPNEGALTRRKMFAGAAFWGLSANMMVRRAAWNHIGPFDEMLGAGTPQKSGEEVDYVLRAASRGIKIYHSSQIRVIHYGFRPQAQTPALFVGYALGTGFMYGKHVRRGDLFAAALWVSTLLRDMWYVTSRIMRGRHPSGARSTASMLKGFWQGLWMSSDSHTSPSASSLLRP